MHVKNMDILILCGGIGSRLRSVLKNKPKPMAKINKRPFLDTLIEHMADSGFRRFILCAGYHAEIIEKHYAFPKKGLEILISKENYPLGTAGALKNAQPFINSNPFLVMNGDSFCPLDMDKFLDFHISKKNPLASIVLSKVDCAKDYGSVKIFSSQRITGFKEKAKRSRDALVNVGIYLFNKKILSLIPSGEKLSLEYDLFPSLTDKKIYGYAIRDSFLDIGTPKRYKEAKRYLKSISKEQ